MNTMLRRVAVSLAATAVATTVALAGAAGASAGSTAGDAQSCLNSLTGRGTATPASIVYPAQPAQVTLSTSQYAGDLCKGLSVSIGISRTDLTGFKAANAGDSRWITPGKQRFSAQFVLPPNQPGTWMTRQIAVKDLAGRTAVKTFTATDSPTKVTIKRESFLTGKPTGSAITHPYVTARLTAWSSVGTMAHLVGQNVLVQVRAPGSSTYVTIAQRRTGDSGYMGISVPVGNYPKHDLRLVFISPFQTIASDYTYLGRIA
ncbi:hypothetical protein [Kribbella deserti]|uniref:Uncharacterized protein n=1 Tax=Kribbella deserti TaxID=1926257 RepID=A0ABV6QK04_9ACTN